MDVTTQTSPTRQGHHTEPQTTSLNDNSVCFPVGHGDAAQRPVLVDGGVALFGARGRGHADLYRLNDLTVKLLIER
jgi:hypothetical protein